ncbi:PspC domain-containing protein [Nocardioides dongxiaopingii]|uniref:ATP-binding protein n=1 Tax=Nocardioides TaxID=1839 RepID=UPI0010C761A1|nr:MULTISPECIES: ATP-binding protein [Nocardioides]QDH10772.1 PspC domain-containing protein [Nocardioides sp. S-1144]
MSTPTYDGRAAVRGPHGQPAPATPRAPRRATRDLDASVVGGVASGLAAHLGVAVLWVRLAFVLCTALSGLGLVLYAVFWVALPAGSQFVAAAPGLESASRGGRRPTVRRRLTDVGPVVVLGVLGVAALFTVEAVFGSGAVFWPVAIAVVGVALLWRQADEVQRERWFDGGSRVNPVRIVFGNGGWASFARVATGLVLLLSALFVVGIDQGSLREARGVVIAGAIGIAGIAVVVGPWVWRLATELSDERTERVRTQERADVAAHLHDSVLQTLALIQKNADDGAVVSRLARAQERDLRAWLYAGESQDDSTVASALRAVAAEVEDAHAISVDVVTVGDVDLDESLRPIVAATRESVTNAAKHAGVGQVDVYAEITAGGAGGAGAIDVFVRDRGAGFDVAAVPEDRHGVRHSIVDRMRRHGGSGEVRSTPGEGTEVRLHLPVSSTGHHEEKDV